MSSKDKSYFTYFTFGLYATLRLLFLTRKGLSLDEAWTLEYANLSYLDILTSDFETNPPLYFILMRFWTSIFGASEFALRLPSVIFSIAAAIYCYKLTKFIFDKNVALLTLLLFSFSTAHIELAQTARTYTLFLFLTTASFYYFAKTLNNNNSKDIGLYSLFTILMLYSHSYAVFNFTAQIITIFFAIVTSNPIKSAFKFWLKSIALITIFFLPWIYITLTQITRLNQSGFWIQKPDFYSLLQCYSFYLFFNTSRNIYWLTFILIILISTYLFINKNLAYNKKILLITCLIFPVIIPTIISLYSTPILFARYAISASIPVYILIAKMFSDLSNKKIKLFLAPIFVIALAIQSRLYFQSKYIDWKSYILALQPEQTDQTLVIVHPFAYKYLFKYYHPKKVYTFLDLDKINPDNYKEIIVFYDPLRFTLVDEINNIIITKLNKKFAKLNLVLSEQMPNSSNYKFRFLVDDI